MNPAQEFMRGALALPIDQQRDALLDAYRRAYAAYGRDWTMNTAAIADDFEFRSRGSRRLPEFGEIRTRDDYVREHERMLEILDVERIEVDDLLPLGDGRIAAYLRFVIRVGDGTIDQQALDVHEFRDGLLFRQTVYLDREEGLRDLGL